MAEWWARQSEAVKVAIITAIVGPVAVAATTAVITLAANNSDAENSGSKSSTGTTAGVPPSAGSRGTPTPTGGGTSASAPKPGPVYLADMPVVDGGDEWSTGSGIIDTKTYERSVLGNSCLPGDSEIAYNLGRQFERLTATIGVPDEDRTGTNVKFTVIVDGVAKYERTVGIGKGVPIDVPISNGLRLILRTELVDVCTSGAIWGDAVLNG